MDISLVSDVIEDPEISQSVTHIPYSGSRNRDGVAIPVSGSAQDIRALIRPTETTEFAVQDKGRSDSARLTMYTRTSHGVSNDDRILFRDTEWRTTEQRVGYASDPEFDVFVLQEDSRSRTADSSVDSADPESASGSSSYDVIG